MSKSTPQLKTISKRPFNAETPIQALDKPLTPNDQFYVRNHFDVPTIDAASWRLQINGAVNTSQQYSLQELQKLPTHTMPVLLECAGNGRASLNPPINGTTWNLGAVAQAEFTGTPLAKVLELANPQSEAVELRFTGSDQGKVRTGETSAYARSLPIEMTSDPDVLLAWEMNGEPLPANHGYPLRLVVPDWYGMASVKWLQEISLITIPFEGFFQSDDYVYSEAQGIPEGAPVKNMRVRSLITSHRNGNILKAGNQEINGIAWSGASAIAEVSISLDGGENWKKTDLLPSTGKYAWTPWQIALVFNKPGTYEIITRASDSNGNIQPLDQIWNRGGYGNNMVQTVEIEVE